MSTYRGIKVTENNLHVESKKSQPGVYRGVKHDAIESNKSDKLQNGIYRGVKHSASLLDSYKIREVFGPPFFLWHAIIISFAFLYS